MTLLDLLVLAIVAALCGIVAQSLVGYSVGGCLVSAVVGYVGALLGLWLARQFGLPQWLTVSIGGHPFPIVWSVLGSVLLVAVLAFFRRATYV
jgi:uncharacterized membrane protein YeaQ/YmgE (transglycosylase-associated protein family)